MSSPRLRQLLAALPDVELPSGAPLGDHGPARDQLGERALRWTIACSRLALRDVLATVAEHRLDALRTPLTGAIETSAVDLMFYLCNVRTHASVTPAQRAAVAELVRLDVPFQRNIAGLRLVQRRYLDALFDLAAGAPAEDRVALVREISDAVGSYFDEMVGGIIDEFVSQRQQMISRQMNDQRETVAALLAGEQVADQQVRERLGIDPGHHHVALIIWRHGAGRRRGTGREAAQYARALADRLGAGAPLIIGGEDSTATWVWLTRAEPFAVTEFAGLDAPPARSALRAAIGVPATGTAGFRRTHLAARDARRVAVHTGDEPRLVHYRDVALLAALLENPERARWMVTDELGPLAAADAASAELRRTVLTYLQSGGSLVATAARLHVHRNTVVYRIRRAGDLLGRPLTERTLETHAALMLADALPRD